MLQKPIFDQHGRQATETGKVRRVWFDIWIVQRCGNQAEPSNQVVLSPQTRATTMLDFHVQFNVSRYSKWVRHFLSRCCRFRNTLSGYRHYGNETIVPCLCASQGTQQTARVLKKALTCPSSPFDNDSDANAPENERMRRARVLKHVRECCAFWASRGESNRVSRHFFTERGDRRY